MERLVDLAAMTDQQFADKHRVTRKSASSARGRFRKDGKRFTKHSRWASADWSLSDAELAKLRGVTRQAVNSARGFYAEQCLKPRRPRVYLTGPVDGVLMYNVRGFEAGKAKLAKAGYNVTSTADIAAEIGLNPPGEPATWDCQRLPKSYRTRSSIKRMTTAILAGRVLAVLPGWRESAIARAHIAIARWATIRILWLDDCGP